MDTLVGTAGECPLAGQWIGEAGNDVVTPHQEWMINTGGPGRQTEPLHNPEVPQRLTTGLIQE